MSNPPPSFPTLLAQLQASNGGDQIYAAALEGFVRDEAAPPPRSGLPTVYHSALRELAKIMGATEWPWPPELLRCAEFFARVFQDRVCNNQHVYSEPYPALLKEVLGAEPARGGAAGDWLWQNSEGSGADLVVRLNALESALGMEAFRRGGAPLSADSPLLNTWERRFLALSDEALLSLLLVEDSNALVQALVAERPGLVRAWVEELQRRGSLGNAGAGSIRHLVTSDGAFADLLDAYLGTKASVSYRAHVLMAVGASANPKLIELFLRHVRDPELAWEQGVLSRLCELAPDQAREQVLQMLHRASPPVNDFAATLALSTTLDLVASQLGERDERVFERLELWALPHLTARAIGALVSNGLAAAKPEAVKTWVRRLLAVLTDNEPRLRALSAVAAHAPGLFFEDWVEMLGASSKNVREMAAEALLEAHRDRCFQVGSERLRAKQADTRLGAVKLLAGVGTADAMAELKSAYATEKSRTVRSEIAAALQAKGLDPSEGASTAPGADAWGEFTARALAGGRKSRAKLDWLDLETLPELFTREGRRIEPAVLAALVSVQAAYKPAINRSRFTITELPDQIVVDVSASPPPPPALAPAPEIAPLLAQIDHARSGDFALALLEAWLASPQDAKDRWALVFAGTLGDTRILSVLNSWIPKWCEKARGKLAEYAAQAIALQGSDEALMLLDALATRYRSKQRNIGAAAAQAFQNAADARGLSADELGDLVVPRFGFDAEGLRDFAWEGGAARAELGVDLKLSWSDPESDKALKGLPPSAPDALKAEVKELGKLLREAAKSQAARLELALVRQRRWPVARWRELYETHPVLRAFATRLVWGVYGADGARLRCFRRYPNGLLADAAGALEELPESETQIGLVHPLELAPEETTAWRAHLARFRVVPPFPQLERAVERLDPLHANRRELAVAQGRQLGAGTFRSRAERRGWQRGSVVDAGGVAGYFKAFPGAGVEVSLELEGLYIGMDPMDTVTLGVARFVRAESVKRGSYVYDDPAAGDARVLPFGQVPSVVYSEALGDLKAIAGLDAASGGQGAETGAEEA